MWWDDLDVKTLEGLTLTRVEQVDEDRIEFDSSDGRKFALYHSQDCCEHVYIESIVGDLSDLVGTPILVAEERTSNDTPEDFKHTWEPESQTWTFYTFRTIKGTVDIRYFGSSNGYYSESVYFTEIK